MPAAHLVAERLLRNSPGDPVGAIRVAMVMAHLSQRSGGVFEAVHGLAPALDARAGMEVGVFGLEHPAPAQQMLRQRGVATEAFPVRGPASFGYAPDLGRALRRGASDLLHVHGLWMYPSIAAMGWTGRAMPYVVTPHGMLDRWALANRRWKKRLAGLAFETRHLRGAACLHALCASELESIRDAGLRNPVCVIPNGVEIPPAPTVATPPLWRGRIPGRAAVLLFLGRIAPQKGIPDLLRGFARYRQEAAGAAMQPKWHLVIAGWGEDAYRTSLQQLATELGLDAVVHFVGPQFGEEKERSFAAADAFVLPSISEGLPIAVLEAWAAHLPVLMTPRCNLAIGFERGGALSIEPEPGSIAEGLRKLASLQPAQRRQIGEQGAKLVAESFSWPKAAESMEVVYRWMLGRGDRPDTVDLA
jgi:glycosyltransferase involved in cell wall biosynthesis